jgi:hypothetical protein
MESESLRRSMESSPIRVSKKKHTSANTGEQEMRTSFYYKGKEKEYKANQYDGGKMHGDKKLIRESLVGITG